MCARPFICRPLGHDLAADLAVSPRNTIIPTADTWLGSFDAGLFTPHLQGSPALVPRLAELPGRLSGGGLGSRTWWHPDAEGELRTCQARSRSGSGRRRPAPSLSVRSLWFTACSPRRAERRFSAALRIAFRVLAVAQTGRLCVRGRHGAEPSTAPDSREVLVSHGGFCTTLPPPSPRFGAWLGS